MATENERHLAAMYRLKCLEGDARLVLDAIKGPDGLKYLKGNIPILERTVRILKDIAEEQ